MTHNQYLRIMFRMSLFYDAHPDFFSMIPDDERLAMSKVFLYDYDDYHDNDDDFPKSIEKFFYAEIDPDKELQEKALDGWARIHELAQMGKFKLEDVPDIHP